MGTALLRLVVVLGLVYGGLGAGLAYWQVVEAQRLTQDPANPLVIAASRSSPRGRILDSRGVVLARNATDANGELVRVYPFPDVAPPVGFKSIRFGSTGIERAYDSQLVGLQAFGPGGEVLRKFRTDPYDPQDVVLSLDLRLQSRAMELLGGQRGAVVALEPATGRVLALASTPSYDPTRLVDPRTGPAYMEELLGAPSDASRLVNRATQGRYVPGSVFKVVTAIAGLGSDRISRETTFADQPEEAVTGFLVEGFRIRDGHMEAAGRPPLDLIQGTEISSNIYYAHAGLEIGGPTLLDWASRLGFGAPIPFELPTEVSLLTRGEGPGGGFLDDVELANAAYGQAQTFVTPLQMALVAACVGNDGILMRPHLADELRDPTSGQATTRFDPQVWQQVLGAGDAAVLQEAMNAAVEGERGQAFAGLARVPGVPTAGKSGTAQLGEGEPHSWFIGFAPVEAPRIAIAVIVERGGRGRDRAVPLAGELMTYYLGLSSE